MKTYVGQHYSSHFTSVLDVVRGLEPKLSSATLSCDISETQRTGETINVELALLSNEMETIFSPNPWFPSLKHTLESGIVNKESTWITDIISVSDPKPLDRESYLFIKDYGKNVVTIDKCSELKEVMSRRYPGFGELVKSCFFDVKSGNIKTEMNYLELMKKGYCCTNYNIYRRIHWSIMELLFGEQHGGDKTKPSGISQPDKTTDKKENLGGDKTEPSGISQPDKTTDKKENLGGDKTEPSGISQPDKTTDKKENLGMFRSLIVYLSFSLICGDKTEPSGISQPDKTTDKKENLLVRCQAMRMFCGARGILSNNRNSYPVLADKYFVIVYQIIGHCIYASFPSGNVYRFVDWQNQGLNNRWIDANVYRLSWPHQTTIQE
ncbi:hypothetical protein Smp_193960 [Schistosoma mansoni]|uniref:hypothetical protein n=1 Tax=Schistosoma mansoni TaxID=6183 RepID=UPI00022DC4D8|nr:hypothetical protein Smp_193960 [Schistosoma mansoni]|eukprot:XP_018652555.1 hypothetical protein Smp_193960 [Schistosoma mansoni]